MELSLSLNPASETSLQTQIFVQVRELILNGVLKARMALPPSRQFAERFGISRNTVTLAYDRLVAEGYILSRGTAGMFVSEILPDSALAISNSAQHIFDTAAECEESSPILCFAGNPGGGQNRPAIDFWVGRSDPDEFPIKIWRRIVNRQLAGDCAYLTDYCDPAGLPELREAIAGHLARARGMPVSSDQIIITSGGQDALNLAYRLVAARSSKLCIENPGYLGAALLFQHAEQELCPIPVDGEGLQVESLPQSKGSLVYVTPSHQFPTGAMLPLKRRLALLKWAEETESFVIEDDYDSDFRYDGPPLTALAGLDRSRHVFYIGTFSKSVGAGLRIGYAVVPKPYAAKARVLKAQMSNGQSWLEQAALSEFIVQGHFERHIRRLRQVYKSRRDCLVGALRSNFVNPDITGLESGLHVMWRLPKGSLPASLIQINARANGIGVYSLKSGAAVDFNQSAPDDVLVLGFSSVPEDKIVQAVARLRPLIDPQGGRRSAAAKAMQAPA